MTYEVGDLIKYESLTDGTKGIGRLIAILKGKDQRIYVAQDPVLGIEIYCKPLRKILEKTKEAG